MKDILKTYEANYQRFYNIVLVEFNEDNPAIAVWNTT